MSKNMGFLEMMSNVVKEGNVTSIYAVIQEQAKQHPNLMSLANQIEKSVATMDVVGISTNLYLFSLLTNTKEMVDLNDQFRSLVFNILSTHPNFTAVLSGDTIDKFNTLDYGIILTPGDPVKDVIPVNMSNNMLVNNYLTDITEAVNKSGRVRSLMSITLPGYDDAKYMLSQVVF